MEAILEPLMRSPRLPHYVDELVELVRKEEDARRKFRETLDEDVRAEFINGEVVVQMTARDEHSMTLKNIARLLGTFVESRRRGMVRTEQALTAFPRNDYAPDVCFWSVAKAASIGGKTTVYPVPDMICEVLSDRTEARDRGVKLEDYAAHGVGEYWIVDPKGGTIEQYVSREGRYELAGKLQEGAVRSTVVAGFEMPVKAAFDDQANLAALRELLKT